MSPLCQIPFNPTTIQVSPYNSVLSLIFVCSCLGVGAEGYSEVLGLYSPSNDHHHSKGDDFHPLYLVPQFQGVEVKVGVGVKKGNEIGPYSAFD